MAKLHVLSKFWVWSLSFWNTLFNCLLRISFFLCSWMMDWNWWRNCTKSYIYIYLQGFTKEIYLEKDRWHGYVICITLIVWRLSYSVLRFRGLIVLKLSLLKQLKKCVLVSKAIWGRGLALLQLMLYFLTFNYHHQSPNVTREKKER